MIRVRRPNRRPTRSTLLGLALLAATALSGALLGPVSSRAGDTPPTNMTTVGPPVSNKETALTRIQRSVAAINEEATTPEGEAAVVARLSSQLRVSPDSLQAQKSEWGVGYGEVAMVYGFARSSKKTGTTPESVVLMRREGKPWEAIAKDLGVNVETVASRMNKQAKPKPKSAPPCSASRCWCLSAVMDFMNCTVTSGVSGLVPRFRRAPFTRSTGGRPTPK